MGPSPDSEQSLGHVFPRRKTFLLVDEITQTPFLETYRETGHAAAKRGARIWIVCLYLHLADITTTEFVIRKEVLQELSGCPARTLLPLTSVEVTDSRSVYEVFNKNAHCGIILGAIRSHLHRLSAVATAGHSNPRRTEQENSFPMMRS